VAGPFVMDEAQDLTRVEAVYRSTHHVLWRALLAYTGDRDVASDAESEAFAQVIRRGAAVVDVAAWVWRSAFTIAAGMLAARAKARSSPGAIADEPSELGASTTEFLSMLGSLSDQQRACVVLRYVAQLDNAGIAAALGTSEGTVRVQLHRAHQSLRRTLEEDDHGR
jgi:RNA polymerase sigma-70 factor (ECF subfamily)